MNSIRVMEYGVTSYWPKTMESAKEVINTILNRNGCGMTQVKRKGRWEIVNRFERTYGIVDEANSDQNKKGAQE